MNTTLKRDVCFVLDRSGSLGMGDRPPLSIARRVVKDSLRLLARGDTFNVVVFDDQPELLARQPLIWSPHTLAYADEQLDRVEAQGGTNLLEALCCALVSMGSRPQPGRPVVTGA